MELQDLAPAVQATLQALAKLGEGNVHEVMAASGKARSTTDRALRALSEDGMIVTVDLGADPAEGTPTRWTLTEETAAAVAAANLGDEPNAGADETGDDNEVIDGQQQSDEDGSGDEEETEDTDKKAGETVAPAKEAAKPAVTTPPRPGDRKVMTIKSVLAENPDGATLDMIVAESGIGDATVIRLLAAMQQADAARRLPPETDKPDRWIAGPTKASEVDPNPEPPHCALCHQVIRGVTTTPAAVAAVQSLIWPDGTLHVIGPDDKPHTIPLPTQAAPRPVNGSPSTVARPSSVTVNADGSEPFGRGELEKEAIAVLTENSGKPMTAGEIATAVSRKFNGRKVSSSAVRNNCTKAAAAGTIQLFSELPLMFVVRKPEPDEETATAEQVDEAPANGDAATDGDQPHGSDGATDGDVPTEPDGNGSEQS